MAEWLAHGAAAPAGAAGAPQDDVLELRAHIVRLNGLLQEGRELSLANMRAAKMRQGLWNWGDRVEAALAVDVGAVRAAPPALDGPREPDEAIASRDSLIAIQRAQIKSLFDECQRLRAAREAQGPEPKSTMELHREFTQRRLDDLQDKSAPSGLAGAKEHTMSETIGDPRSDLHRHNSDTAARRPEIPGTRNAGIERADAVGVQSALASPSGLPTVAHLAAWLMEWEREQRETRAVGCHAFDDAEASEIAAHVLARLAGAPPP